MSHALTGSDPAVCATMLTERFLDQNFGHGDTPAVQECRFEGVLPGEPFARIVRFISVDVHGDRAVALITVAGGEADGSRIRLQLARQRGRWKLDHFADIQIDRPRFDAASRRGLVAAGFTAREAACAVGRESRIFETDQIERALVSGKTQVFAVAEVNCFGRASLVEQLAFAIRKAAPKDAPDEVVDCIVGRIAKGTSTSRLRAIFAVPKRFTDYFEGLARKAARACGEAAQAGLLPHPAPS